MEGEIKQKLSLQQLWAESYAVSSSLYGGNCSGSLFITYL